MPDERNQTSPVARSMAALLEDPTVAQALEPAVPQIAYMARVTLLAAREKDGKSTLGAGIAAAVSRGGVFLGEEVDSGDVLIFSLEEHVADTLRRLQDFGADPERVFIAAGVFGDRLAALERAVRERAYRVVIADTLAALVEGLVRDPFSSADWTPVMSRIARIARESGAAVILFGHSRKGDGGYRDSTAIGAGVDAVLEMSPGAEASIREVRVRARWSGHDFSMRLAGDPAALDTPMYYELVRGELGLDARILLFIQAHPGCSKRTLCQGVSGRTADILAAVDNLLDRGALQDRGDGSGSKLYAAPSASPNVSRPETVSVVGVSPASLRETTPETPPGNGRDAGVSHSPSLGSTPRETPPAAPLLSASQADRQRVLELAQAAAFPELTLGPHAPHVTVPAGAAAWARFAEVGASSELLSAARRALEATGVSGEPAGDR